MAFTCKEVRSYLDAFLDSELDVRETITIQGHLSGCLRCDTLFKAQSRFQEFVRTEQPRLKAPPFLWTRVKVALEKAGDGRVGWFPIMARRWAMASISAGLAAVALVVATALLFRPSGPLPVVRETVNEHILASVSGGTVHVASGDPDVVRSWFSSRLDYAVNVPPAGQWNARLKGGRICYFFDQLAAALAFEEKDKGVSFYILRNSRLELPSEGRLDWEGVDLRPFKYKNYHGVAWRQGEMTYVLVSMMDPGELLRYAADLIRWEKTRHRTVAAGNDLRTNTFGS